MIPSFFMRLILSILLVFLLSETARSQEGKVVDRMVAVVNGKIITQSDLNQSSQWLIENRNVALPEKRLSEEERLRGYLERLLIREEIENYPGLDVSPEEIEVQWKQLFALQPLLAKIPTDQDRDEMKKEIRNQLLYEKYIDLRFRPFVEVPGEEIEKYYKEIFCPEWKKVSQQEVPALSAVQEKIRPILVESKIRVQLDRWIEELRQKAEIQTFPEEMRFVSKDREHQYPAGPK